MEEECTVELANLKFWRDVLETLSFMSVPQFGDPDMGTLCSSTPCRSVMALYIYILLYSLILFIFKSDVELGMRSLLGT